MRSPSPVRNHPLKSAHHTRFGPSACPSGSVYGAVRRRFLRATARPSRFSRLPIVLAAGHFRPGSFLSSTHLSFRGPQLMCPRRSSSTIRSISFSVWFPCRCVARLRSNSPSNPISRYRRNHTYPVSRAISYLWHSSLIVRCRCSYSMTNRSFSSITLLALHGMRSFLLAPAFALQCQGSARSVLSGICPVCTDLPPLPLHSSSQVGVDLSDHHPKSSQIGVDFSDSALIG